jgi:hypothetical protein
MEKGAIDNLPGILLLVSGGMRNPPLRFRYVKGRPGGSPLLSIGPDQSLQIASNSFLPSEDLIPDNNGRKFIPLLLSSFSICREGHS